jgi:hypothetical protein
MSESINFYLVESGDTYKPSEPKPELQQYANYQTHSLYCVDVNVRSEPSNQTGLIQFKSFLAVQAYSTTNVSFDFDAICKQYP